MDKNRRRFLGAAASLGSVALSGCYKVENEDSTSFGTKVPPEEIIEDSSLISDIKISEDGLTIEYEEDTEFRDFAGLGERVKEVRVEESEFYIITSGGASGYDEKRLLDSHSDSEGIESWNVPKDVLEGDGEYIVRTKGVPKKSGSIGYRELGFLLEEDEGEYSFGDRSWGQ